VRKIKRKKVTFYAKIKGRKRRKKVTFYTRTSRKRGPESKAKKRSK